MVSIPALELACSSIASIPPHSGAVDDEDDDEALENLVCTLAAAVLILNYFNEFGCIDAK